MEIHIVQPGETIFSIAAAYGVSVEKILSDNGITDLLNLVTGQALLILFPEVIYTVQSGDTLTSISKKFGTTILTLLQNNPYLASDPTLRPGQQITISYEETREGEVSINGYAYPYINKNVLNRVLPFLTQLTIFGYGFTQDGKLIEIDDSELIALALQYRVAPIMLLSSITEVGNFDSTRASLLFQNVAFQNKVIDQILITLQAKGYYGLDVDFEFIKPEDADAFVKFVQNITTRLNAEGFTVNVDLAPKIAGDQPGLLYEGHRYPELGSAANTVLLMTYEWGYTFGPPMAVAPIEQVRRVVDYGLTVIPASKIYMGIPNYGYDWQLPYEKGTTVATTIGNQYAIQLAAQYGATIQYDEYSQAPFFEYVASDRQKHVVWFEDVRSIQAKLQLIIDKKLLGPGYWNVMRPFAQNWALLNALFYIRKIVK